MQAAATPPQNHDPTSRPVARPDVVQTFDLRTPLLLGFFASKVPSSESPARRIRGPVPKAFLHRPPARARRPVWWTMDNRCRAKRAGCRSPARSTSLQYRSRSTRTTGQDHPRPGSMALLHLQQLDHLQHRLLVVVSVRVHCPAHGSQVIPEHRASGGRSTPGLGPRLQQSGFRPGAPPVPVPSATNPCLAWRGGVWHLLRVEEPCVPSPPFRRSG